MRLMFLSFLALGFLSAAAVSNSSYAISAFANEGVSCDAATAGSAPIRGEFASSYSSWKDDMVEVTLVRCFSSVQACEAWRYRVQSERMYNGVIMANQCERRIG